MLRKTLMLTAAFAMASLGSIGFTQPAPTVQSFAPRQAKRGLFGGNYSHNPMTYGTRGAGITMAQQQRVSRKARNVRRHKALVRGAK